MSQDIRSFFQSKKTPKPKLEEDDDVIPESPDVQIKNKKKLKSKRLIIDDSDEEIFDKKKAKTSNIAISNKNNNKSVKPTLKEVQAVDIFGGVPIKRTKPLRTVNKVKKETETGIHSDDEFDKSLLEIDFTDNIDKVQTTDNKTSCTVEKNETLEEESSEGKSKQTNTIKSDTELKSKHLQSRKDRVTNKIENGPNKEQKRKFSEFVDDKNVSDIKECDERKEKKKRKLDDESHSNHEEAEVTMKRVIDEDHEKDSSIMDSHKKKFNKSLNESVLTDEERYERKRHSAQLYQKYLNRTGPKHLGAKEIPEGSPNCLKDCAFLLTGVLDSFEREEIVEAINKYSGSIKNTMSRKVTHVLAGEDAGPAKMAKAEELGIKIINEDEFLNMIRDGSNKSEDKLEIKEVKKETHPSRKSKDRRYIENDKSSKEIKVVSSSKELKAENSSKDKSPNIKTEGSSKEIKSEGAKNGIRLDVKNREKSKSPAKTKSDVKEESKIYIERETKLALEPQKEDNKEVLKQIDIEKPVNTANFSMWVEKYKPQNLKQIIGQHGDASNVKKLTNWLTKWYVNRKAKLPKPSPWAKSDDGGYFKAVLLSGPPGVGKTTTVSLVCKELGFDAVEFNASDTRNKTLIKEQIGELLTTTSLSGYAKGVTGKQAVSKKHVLVMDEVDGMAGNEDRGGLQELIGLIKSTSVPIICMCNDRNSQKMRSLVNYCYDLRFSRPRVEQIKSAMLSICCKEGIKIPPDVISQLIVSAGQDVRQTLNLLSMWAIDPTRADADRLRKDATSVRKDLKLGPWDAVRKVFSAEDHKTMSIHNKSDLFFYDYSLSPLFVQENYLQVAPHCPKNEVLHRVSMAADSISIGDLVGARIRGSQAWSLLPMQAMYSSVMPGHAMSGHMTGQIQFPGWLGKNSRASKMQRLCQEIHAHTRLSTTGSKSSIFLDYSTHLRDAIINPLIKDKADGVSKSLEILESYHLLREDLESLTEMSVWPGQRNPTVLIDSKVKAAMTRTYNKTASALPYAPGAVRRGTVRNDEELGDDDDVPEEDGDDSDPENDALIKKKKSKETEKPSSSKEKKDKPSTSKKSTSSKEKSKKTK